MKRAIPWAQPIWRSGILGAVPAIAALVLLVTAAVQAISSIVGALYPSATMDGLTWRQVRFSTESYGAGHRGRRRPGVRGRRVGRGLDVGGRQQLEPGPGRRPEGGAFVNAFIDTLVAGHGRLYAGGSGQYGEARIWVSSGGIRWRVLVAASALGILVALLVRDPVRARA